MTNTASKTFAQCVDSFLSIHYNYKLFVKRSVDKFTIRQFLNDRQRRKAIKTQTINVIEHADLGSDAAVSKFVIKYGLGQVKNQDGKWINDLKNVPKTYDESFRVTAIRMPNANLITEGVDNFVGLESLESIDLSSNPKLDDFACDQLARQFRTSKSLVEVNLNFNNRISVHGLEILFRIPSIKRIFALDTQASKYDDIDLFVLAAEEERNCDVFVHKFGQKYRDKSLEELK